MSRQQITLTINSYWPQSIAKKFYHVSVAGEFHLSKACSIRIPVFICGTKEFSEAKLILKF